MNERNGSILVIGYGNPGRLDDGLGPALAEEVERLNLPEVTVDANYLLTVEDAPLIAAHELVIFADASVRKEEPFLFERIMPKSTLSFSSHSVAPAHLLGLAYELFGAATEAYILAIRGYAFDDFGERLSPRARQNLDKAVEFLVSLIHERRFAQTEGVSW